ncbi:hypothetical protein BJ944DRAFT_268598 [Cunninghamella echinulata]|nr:hypothetical protein BJ944DRAFT_268598 [Cunninghamella echinulata]
MNINRNKIHQFKATVIPSIVCFVKEDNLYINEINENKIKLVYRDDTIPNYIDHLLEKEYPYEGFFICDELTTKNKTIKVVKINEQDKQDKEFRCTLKSLYGVFSSLFTFNMDLDEFYNAKDDDGVFRSFCNH